MKAIGGRVAVLLVGLAACGEPTEPVSVAGPLQLSSGGPVVASATGGAQRIRSDELWVLSFTAVRHADGSATGNYHVDRQDLGVKFDVDVTCMTVVGDTAWIAGIIRKVDGPIVIEGTVSYFWAVDHGEGSGAPTDIASAIRINDLPGRDQEFCTTRPTVLVPSTIAFGNIQVRTY